MATFGWSTFAFTQPLAMRIGPVDHQKTSTLRMDTCKGIANHDWLIEEFVTVLENYHPTDVFDVGCGTGRLMKACRGRGITVVGLDQAGPRLRALAVDGFDVREGSAYELPLADQSVDWVVLRHVPHHLQDPARAFKELLRVAKSGVLIAEPYFDGSVPSQRSAISADLWEKAQHRRRGMYHEPVYSLGSLLDLMPDDYAKPFHVDVHKSLRLRERSIEDFHTDAQALLEGLEPHDPHRVRLAVLLEELKQTGLTWNGSLLVAFVRR